MDHIIQDIVEEICYLSSIGAVTKDCYLEELTAALFDQATK